MKLTKLYIHRDDWTYRGSSSLKGTITLEGNFGEISLNLSEQQASEIISVVADSLVENSKNIANSMTREIIEHKHDKLENLDISEKY